MIQRIQTLYLLLIVIAATVLLWQPVLSFTSAEDAIRNETDIVSDSEIIESRSQRLKVDDTDTGRELREQIAELTVLLSAYEDGTIPEKG